MADFQKVLVKDDRLDVTEKIKYAVVKGGQNVTCAQFNAIATSRSQMTFNIQVPSEQTIIDRRVLLKTKLNLKVTTFNNGLDASAGQLGCRYGHNSALAPFPLHQLMSVASATINNNTVSVNVQDVLPAIMRLIDKEELQAYNGTTPTYQDSYYSYFDSLNNNNNPLGLYNNATDTYNTPRGSVRVLAYSTDISTNSLGTGTQTENFTFELTEPLLISPFIFAHPKSNAQGFYGVQNLNFVFNLASVAGEKQRVFRGLVEGPTKAYNRNSPAPANIPYITGVELVSLTEPSLLFTFLTPHPSDLMPARNVVPYYELPRYITQIGGIAASNPSDVNNNSLIPSVTSEVFNSQSLQLNQIPDKLIIMIRKVLGNQNAGDADACLPIKGVSINFNNQSGILSSATREDLYRMTKDNCSTLNWYEFSGLVSDARIASGSGSGNAVLANTFTTVPTVGSFLVLEFGKDIQLVEDFYSAGSLGNFNLQVRVNTENPNPYAFSANQEIEMVIITMNSGVFVNERGTSATYTGILTKADVLEASDQEAYTHSDVRRLVGGGFLDMVKSAAQKIAPIAKAVAPIAKGLLEQSGNRHAQTAASVMGALGMGASGGALGMGVSGGGVSGGRLGRRLM
jgi:hypothetical protein